MKKTTFLFIFVCFVSIFALSGCDKDVSSAQIVRDDARTGGSLSFVYDQKERMVFFGGEDEVVQYSSADETKNLDEGCRVGLKVSAPSDVTNVENATLEMNGINYSSADFLESVNGQKQRFFNVYPSVSKEDKEVGFAVKWQDGTKKQKYKIKIEKGTKFMKKDGTIE